MPVLNNDLSDFACTILHGKEPSSRIDVSYSNYSVTTAIEIYRNNYRGNLHDTLAGAYPVMEQLVGKEFFRLLTRRFIEQHFSHSGNLHHYGAELAAFVATFEPVQELAYLPDVTALEWACHCAYFADDATTLDIDKLAQVPPEQYPNLILHIHPACHLVRSCYPIAAIWHAHQPGASGDFHIDLDSGSSNALVSRKNDVVLVNELTEADAAWLQSIQAGTQLGGATATTLELYTDFNLQAALLKLVEQDVLTNFNLGAAS
ncbi:putative DNA-binding domain-containing protein [Candidatus Nitrotoga sp. BS]|uniref:HvfC/BufC N-terminal domain-containing protein n=1 Tax=Candidatus Nitrotoga sp. BS TaxID=2890408 RepID=UPI001EF30BE5|nr:putative DNA-binding domain-containing protein [Candidatus Nitrotoga sp. BS]CAH1198124.1 putative DNA-binding domain-containing protein [Candidatus Nitrotoga sp. BS]